MMHPPFQFQVWPTHSLCLGVVFLLPFSFLSSMRSVPKRLQALPVWRAWKKGRESFWMIHLNILLEGKKVKPITPPLFWPAGQTHTAHPTFPSSALALTNWGSYPTSPSSSMTGNFAHMVHCPPIAHATDSPPQEAQRWPVAGWPRSAFGCTGSMQSDLCVLSSSGCWSMPLSLKEIDWLAFRKKWLLSQRGQANPYSPAHHEPV